MQVIVSSELKQPKPLKTNANIRHKNIMFKPQVSIFVKAWVVSVRVNE